MAKDELYANYIDFKGWSPTPAFDTWTFPGILALAGKPGRLALLEIGYGEGIFMDWAREQGHRIMGIEVIPQLVENARSRGHSAWLAKEFPRNDGSVDVLVAIDVLEHLDADEILELLELADSVLKPDGAIVARFPNGSSPFSGHYHSGDYTHERAMSAGSLGQIARMRSFALTAARNPRPLPERLGPRLKQLLAYFARDIIEILLGYIYYGYRLPMDPNIIVLLERIGPRSGDGLAAACSPPQEAA